MVLKAGIIQTWCQESGRSNIFRILTYTILKLFTSFLEFSSTILKSTQMKSLILFCLFACFSSFLLAQSDSITTTRIFGGYKFEQNGQVLKSKMLLEIMESDPEAYAMMKKAKSNLDVGSVFAGAGGFLVGWALGTMLGGGEFNPVIAGIGAGCLAIGIPVSSGGSKLAVKAAGIYNSNLEGTAFEQGLQLRFGTSTYGIGLTMTF